MTNLKKIAQVVLIASGLVSVSEFGVADHSKADSGSTYMQASSSANLKGIDISHWDGSINWDQVKNSGIAFAYMKASGGSSPDPMFAKNVQAARAVHLPIGAYHYAKLTAPFNADEPKQQANYFVNVMKTSGLADYGDIMPVLDLEEPAKTGVLSADQIAQWVRIFVDNVHSLTNRQVMLYTGVWFVQQNHNFSNQLADLPLWIADYKRNGDTQPPAVGGWKQWLVWQYSDQGTVSGLTSQVDLDAGPTSLDQLKGSSTKTTSSTTTNSSGFVDVEDANPYSSYIKDLKLKNLINGTGDNQFSPANPLTRAEFAKLMVTAFAVPAVTTPIPFNDSQNHWAASYIETAYENGIVKGTSASTFEPDHPVTREEAATMMWRYLSSHGVSASVQNFMLPNTVDDWAKTGVAQCAAKNLFGVPFQSGSYQDTMSRQEAAALIDSAISLNKN